MATTETTGPLPTPEQIRDQHIEKHGMQISKTLLDIHESYNELESDPGLWELLIRDLAGPDIVDVNEVLEVNRSLRSQVGEGEIYGIILLYLVDDRDRNQRSYNKELGSKFERDEAIVNNMFFPLQKVPNACATYAALSVLLNSPSLPLGPLLREFKEFTQGMSSEAKGYAVGNSPQVAAYHNRRAPVTTAYAASVSAKPGSNRTATHTYIQSRTHQFHFVPYVLINGDLMELDGLRDYPISHGAVSAGEDWTEKCRTIIGERMKKSTGLSYTLLVVKSCRRTKCIEDTAKINGQISDALQTIQASKEKLDELPAKLPKELSTLMGILATRNPLSSVPAEVPVDLHVKTEDVLELCESTVDSLRKMAGKRMATLAKAEVPVERVSDRKEVSLPGSSNSSPILSSQDSFHSVLSSQDSFHTASQVTTPSPSPRGSKKITIKREPVSPPPKMITLDSPIYAPGYSLRSSISNGICTYPSKVIPRPPGEAACVEVKTETMDACINTISQHLKKSSQKHKLHNTPARNVPRKNGRFVSASRLSDGTSPEIGRPGDVTIRQSPASAASSRAASVVSTGPSPPTTSRMTTRRSTRSAASSTSTMSPGLLASLSSGSLTPSPTATGKELRFHIKQESGSSASGGTNSLRVTLVKEKKDTNWTPNVSPSASQANSKSLEESNKNVGKWWLEVATLDTILTSVEMIKTLEEERVKLYGTIVEENSKRSVNESDAEERECDHDLWITLLLKRMFEIDGLVTQDELEALIPNDVRRKLEGSPDSDSSNPASASAAKRINNKRPSDSGSSLKNKIRKSRP